MCCRKRAGHVHISAPYKELLLRGSDSCTLLDFNPNSPDLLKPGYMERRISCLLTVLFLYIQEKSFRSVWCGDATFPLAVKHSSAVQQWALVHRNSDNFRVSTLSNRRQIITKHGNVYNVMLIRSELNKIHRCFGVAARWKQPHWIATTQQYITSQKSSCDPLNFLIYIALCERSHPSGKT